MNLGFYFIYRKTILGTYIGGYSNSIFGSDFFNLSFIYNWIISTFAALFWQPANQTYLLWFSLAGVMILLFGATKHSLTNFTIKKFFLLLLFPILHLILALPTAQFALDIQHTGIFSSRMYILPVITSCLMIGYLSYRSSTICKIIALPLILIPLIAAHISTANSFTKAANFTKESLSVFKVACTCTNVKHPQIFEMPQHISSVNVATENSWLEYQALLQGTERCANNESRCEIGFKNSLGHSIPIIKKTSILTSEAGLLPVKETANCITVKARNNRELGITRLHINVDISFPNCQNLHALLLINKGEKSQIYLPLSAKIKNRKAATIVRKSILEIPITSNIKHLEIAGTTFNSQ
jgi:hypothetical protein